MVRKEKERVFPLERFHIVPISEEKNICKITVDVKADRCSFEAVNKMLVTFGLGDYNYEISSVSGQESQPISAMITIPARRHGIS